MLASMRQEHIRQLVAERGGVRVADVAQELGVSDMTVRRDIAALARRGLVARVHGGATATDGRSAEEPGFAVKSTLALPEKAAIAAAAVALISPGDSVAISAGTTTHAVARALRGHADLTVVTNSLPVAQELHDGNRVDRTVLLTGGVRTPSDALVGPVAVAALHRLHVDWLFLGVHGIDERCGLTTPNLVEADTDRALVAAARRVVVVADSSKWDVVGLATIVDLEEVDVLVTDDGLPEDARKVVQDRMGRLVLASRSPA